MAKKKSTRPRKRNSLKANTSRQANDPLRGYLYQIWHSVNAWLDLSDDEILYLEGAEDYDTVSDDAATAVQVKNTQHNITLRAREVIDAINNYWELRTNNLDRRVKYRFLTRSKIGMEQGNPFGTGKPGLQVWSRCSSDNATITEISEFLQTEGKISDEVKDFLKQVEPQEIYEKLIEPITWETGCKPASFVEQSINEKLILHGNQLGFLPSEAKKGIDPLIQEAWKVATQKENRVLAKVRFLEIFEEQTTQSVSTQYLRHLQMQTTTMGNVGTLFPAGSSDISIQSYSPVLNTIPPLFPDVIQRTNLLTSIKAKLQSEGIVVVHGGTGRGKTTLAKLTAKDTSGSWLWLSLTNREPSQIAQHLQQLAIEISNQSSPVNIVLDDLNLQPQQLRKYEEILGIVVYRVLEHGAKLLITSQHKLPNNFVLRLGASRSIVIHVPDFTISEIEQFAEQLACPSSEVKPWASLIQAHTGGHPRLVHARLARLREENWKRPDTIEGIVQTPGEVVEEREAAQQLLTDLPDNQREFLYRLSLMLTEFRRDYAISIGEIPESIPYAGDIFNQLVGPWIDRIHQTYYTISPLLTNAAKQVWSESKINDLHAQIADAILESRDLTKIEARAVLFHSMLGQNELGFIAVIRALMTAPEHNWKELSREFSWVIYAEPDIPEKFFPGSAVANHLFRSLQYRIAVEVEPESAPKILKIWDKETKPHEPHQLYHLDRLMLATQALMYGQASLSAKKIVDYLREIIEITNNHKEIQEIYDDSMGQLKGYKTDKSNYFSLLFGFICARRPIYAPFLSDLIDALDELQPEFRTLLLADFEDDTVHSRLLIDGIWGSEADRENPDWTRCLQVFDKVIEKTIEWGYPHIAAASTRGIATIHDEFLHDPDTAHKVLRDIISKVGPSPIIEEEQAVIYLHQKRYKEALNIYDRILPQWNPPSGQLDVMPAEGCRRAAMCAAHLGDWESAATFFEDGAKRTLENTERQFGFYADAGFANYRVGKMPDCIKLLYLALQKFETFPKDKRDVRYFTLKQRLAYTIRWMAEHEHENYSSEPVEPPVGFCSNPETNEGISSLPDFSMGYAWLYLAQIEYNFGHGTEALEHAVEIIDRDECPNLDFFRAFVKTQYDFRNKTFYELPQRIHQLVIACDLVQSHIRSAKGLEEQGANYLPIVNPPNFASVENITTMLVAALLVQMWTNSCMHGILAIWRSNSAELPIQENMFSALDLIELMLSGDQKNALEVMRTQGAKYENRLAATLRILDSNKTSPENLFHAHMLITTAFIGHLCEGYILQDLAEFLSAQWLEKTRAPGVLRTPRITVPEIERACKGSETGKKKIGKILLAAQQAVSIRVPTEILQQFRSWADSESKQKPEPKTAKNLIAQRLIRAMEKPPHLTHEDVEVLRQSIEEGKTPIKFDSLFEPDESENQ